MKVNNYKRITNLAGTCFLGILLLLVTACNEVMEDSLRYDYPASGSNYESGHVLLVVMVQPVEQYRRREMHIKLLT